MDVTKMGTIQLQNPCHPSGLLHKANQMRLAGTLCDVVIMVDSQEFHAHRTVLACTSKMFEILFHRNSQHYTLDFLSPKTFQQILEYAYTATLQARVEDLDDLLYAAEILEIEYLEEQCLKILETIQASEDNDAEGTAVDGAAAEEEEERRSRYIKGLFVSKPTSEESGYAGQSLPAGAAEQSPSASASFGPLSAMSPTKAAVDSLMSIGQSLLQGALPPAAPEDSRPAAARRPNAEAMQVDDTPGSPRSAEPGASGGEKPEEKGKDGPGTPTRGSVITSARELHYGREEGAEPPPEPGQGLPLAPEPLATSAPADKPLGIYSLLPNHKTEPVLAVPPAVASALHVQPALAVSMDFGAYGGLLPQGFIQRELFSKLGELAAGMKPESRALGEQCSVCGAELPDNETLEQHRWVPAPRFTPGSRSRVSVSARVSRASVPSSHCVPQNRARRHGCCNFSGSGSCARRFLPAGAGWGDSRDGARAVSVSSQHRPCRFPWLASAKQLAVAALEFRVLHVKRCCGVSSPCPPVPRPSVVRHQRVCMW